MKRRMTSGVMASRVGGAPCSATHQENLRRMSSRSVRVFAECPCARPSSSHRFAARSRVRAECDFVGRAECDFAISGALSGPETARFVPENAPGEDRTHDILLRRQMLENVPGDASPGTDDDK